jgi:hypothetical protein
MGKPVHLYSQEPLPGLAPVSPTTATPQPRAPAAAVPRPAPGPPRVRPHHWGDPQEGRGKNKRANSSLLLFSMRPAKEKPPQSQCRPRARGALPGLATHDPAVSPPRALPLEGSRLGQGGRTTGRAASQPPCCATGHPTTRWTGPPLPRARPTPVYASATWGPAPVTRVKRGVLFSRLKLCQYESLVQSNHIRIMPTARPTRTERGGFHHPRLATVLISSSATLGLLKGFPNALSESPACPLSKKWRRSHGTHTHHLPPRAQVGGCSAQRGRATAPQVKK